MFAPAGVLPNRLLRATIFLAVLAACRTSEAHEVPPQSGKPSSAPARDEWAVQSQETFRVVWTTINEAYFDETFGGVNWRAVGERYRERVATIVDDGELRRLLWAMLGELGRSHFAIRPREASVFRPSERTRLGTTGIEVSWVEGRVVTTRVRAGSAGERAGVGTGLQVRMIGGVDLAQAAATMRKNGFTETAIGRHLNAFVQRRLGEAAGAEVALEGEAPDGRVIVARMATEAHDGAWSEPLGNFPSMPLECDTHRANDSVAYVRFNAFAPALMKQLRGFLRSLQNDEGLIIDLRGNPGGVSEMAVGIAGLLTDRELVLGTMRLRRGTMKFVAYPQERAFLGPVAILVDGQSASTSEILAAGLRDHGRARLFGERTAGAALPSAFRALPNGDLLQYAIADVRTPREATIEGNGVEPDVTTKNTPADLAAGRDAPLETAKQWLVEQRQIAAK